NNRPSITFPRVVPATGGPVLLHPSPAVGSEAPGDSEPSDVSEAEAFPPLNSAARGLNDSRKGIRGRKEAAGGRRAVLLPRDDARFQLLRALVVLLRCTHPAKVATACVPRRGDGEGGRGGR
ncbi:hypothetical protein BHE74_00044078, partial [Ensete ventricosum]